MIRAGDSIENPVTGEKVIAHRKRVRCDVELPMKDDYSAFLRNLMARQPGEPSP